jgi:hypothetical protein
MDRTDLRDRMWRGLTHLQETLGTVPGARVHRSANALAALVPLVPEASLVNAAVPESGRNLTADELESIRAAYATAQLPKWGLWLDPDVQDTGPLRAVGLQPDSRPAPMGAALAEMPPHAPDPAVRAIDFSTLGRLNDLAYGHGDERLTRLLRALEQPTTVHVHGLDGPDGEPAAGLAIADLDGDAIVWFVATVPWWQNRGLARRVLSHGLHEAAARGLRTTTLQASTAGRPLYERLGYQTLGSLELWERRP